MEIILCGMDETLCEAWRTHCGDLPGVQVYEGSVFDIEIEAMVSPSNSFGFMDGGIDVQIREYLGDAVEEELRQIIADEFQGELLVGQALVLSVDHPMMHFLISAPTMRMPTVLPADTVNPYLATRAALRAIQNTIVDTDDGPVPLDRLLRAVAFPGMGTGIGEVSHDRCALQMRQAIIDVMIEPIPPPTDWDVATDRYRALVD